MTSKQYIRRFYEEVIMPLYFDTKYKNINKSIITRVRKIYIKNTKRLHNPIDDIPAIIGYDEKNNIRIKYWYLSKFDKSKYPNIIIYDKYGNILIDAYYYNTELYYKSHTSNIISEYATLCFESNFKYELMIRDINNMINNLCNLAEFYYNKI